MFFLLTFFLSITNGSFAAVKTSLPSFSFSFSLFLSNFFNPSHFLQLRLTFFSSHHVLSPRKKFFPSLILSFVFSPLSLSFSNFFFSLFSLRLFFSFFSQETLPPSPSSSLVCVTFVHTLLQSRLFFFLPFPWERKKGRSEEKRKNDDGGERKKKKKVWCILIAEVREVRKKKICEKISCVKTGWSFFVTIRVASDRSSLSSFSLSSFFLSLSSFSSFSLSGVPSFSSSFPSLNNAHTRSRGEVKDGDQETEREREDEWIKWLGWNQHTHRHT